MTPSKLQAAAHEVFSYPCTMPILWGAHVALRCRQTIIKMTYGPMRYNTGDNSLCTCLAGATRSSNGAGYGHQHCPAPRTPAPPRRHSPTAAAIARGVMPCCDDSRLGSAPALSRASTASACPDPAAQNRGGPDSLLAFTSAPARTSRRTTIAEPAPAARCSAPAEPAL